jgi:hypothetical protein
MVTETNDKGYQSRGVIVCYSVKDFYIWIEIKAPLLPKPGVSKTTTTARLGPVPETTGSLEAPGTRQKHKILHSRQSQMLALQ